MNEVLRVFAEMREVQAELAQLERVIADHPEYGSLEMDLLSLQKRQQSLESRFEQLTNQKHVDIVNYRLMPGDLSHIPLRAVTSTLDKFQAAVSTIFDALLSGPKKRARLSADVVEKSSFDFAYTFSGSLGVVLTIPNDRLLVGDSELDTAVERFFAGAQCKSREEIVEFAKANGIPAVRRVYEWSNAHAQYGISADVQWRRNATLRSRLAIDTSDLERLKEIIEETSDTEKEVIAVTGFLVGLDTKLESFHLIVPDADDIRGAWSNEYAYDPDHTLNERYEARILRQSVTYYAFDKEEVTWSLLSLRKVQA